MRVGGSRISRLIGTVVAAAAAAVLAGCALAPAPKAHYIMVHKEGDPYSREREKLDRAEFDAHLRIILAGIDAHVRDQRTADRATPARILIFVHGGLNPYAGSLRRVRQLLDTDPRDVSACRDSRGPTEAEREAEAADARNQDEHRRGRLHCTSYYPVFINWNSSLFSSLWDDLFIIRGGKREPFVAAVTAPFLLVGRLLDSAISVPYSLWLFARPEPPPPPYEGDPDPDKGLTYYGLAPVRGLTVPFIRGFGTGAWEVMKRRADFVTAEILPEEAVADLAKRTTGKEFRHGAGLTFMRALAGRLCIQTDTDQLFWLFAPAAREHRGRLEPCRDGDPGQRVEITLAGHSMGALVVNRILRVFAYLPFQHIVYLAAAASLGEFEDSVLPYLDRHPQAKFYSFSLSLNRERYEKGPGDFYERGSLLVWIDYLFERVNTLEDLRAGRYRNLWQPSARYVEWLRDHYPGRVEFYRLTAPGAPLEHGDFGNRAKLPCLLRLADPGAVDKAGCESVTAPYEPPAR